MLNWFSSGCAVKSSDMISKLSGATFIICCTARDVKIAHYTTHSREEEVEEEATTTEVHSQPTQFMQVCSMNY